MCGHGVERWIDGAAVDGYHPSIKILKKELILVLMQVFGAEVDFVIKQQLVKHMQQNVCLARVAWPAHQHPERI